MTAPKEIRASVTKVPERAVEEPKGVIVLWSYDGGKSWTPTGLMEEGPSLTTARDLGPDISVRLISINQPAPTVASDNEKVLSALNELAQVARYACGNNGSQFARVNALERIIHRHLEAE